MDFDSHSVVVVLKRELAHSENPDFLASFKKIRSGLIATTLLQASVSVMSAASPSAPLDALAAGVFPGRHLVIKSAR